MRVAWIVDDDDEMSQAVSLMLRLLDFSSEIFRDARSTGRQMLQGRRPDIFILDDQDSLVGLFNQDAVQIIARLK